MAQLVKNLPAMQETWVRSVGWEDSPGEEGKSYPLQHSGLENSMDCLVYGVTKSQTRLSDFHFHFLSQTSLVARTVKHLSTMRETRVQSLGKEDPLEKGKTTHFHSGLENSMDISKTLEN